MLSLFLFFSLFYSTPHAQWAATARIWLSTMPLPILTQLFCAPAKKDWLLPPRVSKVHWCEAERQPHQTPDAELPLGDRKKFWLRRDVWQRRIRTISNLQSCVAQYFNLISNSTGLVRSQEATGKWWVVPASSSRCRATLRDAEDWGTLQLQDGSSQLCTLWHEFCSAVGANVARAKVWWRSFPFVLWGPRAPSSKSSRCTLRCVYFFFSFFFQSASVVPARFSLFVIEPLFTVSHGSAGENGCLLCSSTHVYISFCCCAWRCFHFFF